MEETNEQAKEGPSEKEKEELIWENSRGWVAKFQGNTFFV